MHFSTKQIPNKYEGLQRISTGIRSNTTLKTDGFKKIVKGVSCNQNNQNFTKNMISSSQSSVFVKSQAKQFTIKVRNHESGIIQKDYDFNGHRTKTAAPNRIINLEESNQTRENLFQKYEREEVECFKNLCQKLLS